MTGENWNTVMYAGMRSAGPGFALLFVLIILFGQTLFLSLFLSMLMSKFDDVKDALNNQELERQQTAQKLLEAQKLRKKSLESPCLTEDLSGHSKSRLMRPARSLLDTFTSFKTSLEQRQSWPTGYAWFIFSKTNPMRRFCLWILHCQARRCELSITCTCLHGGQVEYNGQKMKVRAGDFTTVMLTGL